MELPMCLGIPGKVIETYREHDILMGKVEFGGISKRVCLEHVPDVQCNDYVLVHVGFALCRIDEAEAKRVFEFLDSMDQLDELGPLDVEEIDLNVTPAPDRPPEPTRSTAPSATE
jgi:hydrogenase expression/formation protein HypC